MLIHTLARIEVKWLILCYILSSLVRPIYDRDNCFSIIAVRWSTTYILLILFKYLWLILCYIFSSLVQPIYDRDNCFSIIAS